ncbi:sphingomyelin synthase-related 1-like [Glandiceps talaboti]
MNARNGTLPQCNDGDNSTRLQLEFTTRTNRLSVDGHMCGRSMLIFVIAFVITMFLSSLATVIANNQRPDVKEHPPLPDIVFKNITPLANAHYIVGATLGLLVIIAIGVLFLHNKRASIFQQYISSVVMIYMLRNLCMVVTSLPVTYPDFPCAAKSTGNLLLILKQTIEEFISLGSSTSSGATCADYMFSGHTVTFIYLSYYITKYSVNVGGVLHIFCWMTSVIGIISLSVSFFHYTMDIIISLIIAPLFLVTHEILLDNPGLRAKYKLIRIFFPLLHFIEGGPSQEERNHLVTMSHEN